MTEPYSLEEIVRAEIKLLDPGSEIGARLPRDDEAETPPRTVMTRMREWFATLRRAMSASGARPSEASQELPEELSRKLFEQKMTALCLSGGGIRSASFCLGVLQALAQRRLLTKFDYLSTVSGGGYIGGWLTAWGSRAGWNMAGVEEALADHREAKQLENLRDFTNYITPRVGLMSADTWVGVATVARNLALNWSLFLPVFLITVAIPKFVAACFEWLAQQDLLLLSESGAALSIYGVMLLLLAAVLYGGAELFISDQILTTQEEKNAEDAEAKPAAGGKPEMSVLAARAKPRRQEYVTQNKPYGAGNVESALTIVCLIAAASCVSTGILTRAKLPLTLEMLATFGSVGVAIWLTPFLLACLGAMRRRRSERANAVPVAKVTAENRENLTYLAWARGVGGLGFGLSLLIGFHLLGEYVDSSRDDRYAVVIGLLIYIVAHLVGGTVFSALTSRVSRMDDALEWSARGAGWLVAAGVAWGLYASLVLLDPEDVFSYALGLGNKALLAAGGLSGLGAAIFGYSRNTSVEKGTEESRRSGLNLNSIAVLAAVIFFIVLILECSFVFDQVVFDQSFARLIQHRAVGAEHFLAFLMAFVVLALWTGVASYFVNVNKFSLHGFYRNRLIRAYLGASNLTRRPNAFTGFDQGDNIPMGKLHCDKPLHIVNTALNLVHGDKLAWQERKASSFTISRIASGNPVLGYRPSSLYGQKISLGTAIAISGAAVSPNMGYHSSPVLAFLMTLFNARLGWWLGNPRREAWDLSGPRQAFWALLMELFGYTTEDNRFIYLSDGGHFENLGVYEMLRRRCRTIVAIDAACDPDLKYEDLGNMVRKARIDFGIEISFSEPAPPLDGAGPTRLGLVNRPGAPGRAPYCIVGEIRYPGIEERGSLIYIKAAIHGDEPEDVWSYAAAHPDFPHESTGDQFFSESQFESYRRLGLYVGAHVMGGDGEEKTPALDIAERAKASVARG